MSQEAYFNKSTTFETDLVYLTQKSERRAWLVAGVSTVVTTISVIGCVTLAKIHEVVPYVIGVNQHTGTAEIVKVLSDPEIRRVMTNKEALDQHWLRQYVQYRESYFYPVLQHDYLRTISYTDQAIVESYKSIYDGENARDKKYGTNTEVTIKVISVTLLPDQFSHKAQVRFERTLKRIDANAVQPTQTYVATIAYAYAPKIKATQQELIENPLGFKVTGYRLDSELTTPPQATQAN